MGYMDKLDETLLQLNSLSVGFIVSRAEHMQYNLLSFNIIKPPSPEQVVLKYANFTGYEAGLLLGRDRVVLAAYDHESMLNVSGDKKATNALWGEITYEERDSLEMEDVTGIAIYDTLKDEEDEERSWRIPNSIREAFLKTNSYGGTGLEYYINTVIRPELDTLEYVKYATSHALSL